MISRMNNSMTPFRRAAASVAVAGAISAVLLAAAGPASAADDPAAPTRGVLRPLTSPVSAILGFGTQPQNARLAGMDVDFSQLLT